MRDKGVRDIAKKCYDKASQVKKIKERPPGLKDKPADGFLRNYRTPEKSLRRYVI